MLRTCFLATLIGLLGAAAESAEPARFKFEKGQVLTYNVVQATKVVETIIDEKTTKPVEMQITTKHTAVRRWKVAEIDDKGIATLEMTIASMKWEHTAPDGTTEVFDSSKP